MVHPEKGENGEREHACRQKPGPDRGKSAVGSRPPPRHPVAQPRKQRVQGCRTQVNQEADPVWLLQREDRLPEREQRHKHEPLGRGGEDRPWARDQKNGRGPETCRPATQQPEEKHLPGEIGPLVKQDPADDHRPGGLDMEHGVARRDAGDHRPVHGCVAADPARDQLADECREAAADKPEQDRRTPVRTGIRPPGPQPHARRPARRRSLWSRTRQPRPIGCLGRCRRSAARASRPAAPTTAAVT